MTFSETTQNSEEPERSLSDNVRSRHVGNAAGRVVDLFSDKPWQREIQLQESNPCQMHAFFVNKVRILDHMLI